MVIPQLRKKPERFTDANVIMKLDEIAKRLADRGAEGILQSRAIKVGTKWVTMLQTSWLSCTIYNDGESDIYIRLDDMSTIPWGEGEAPLKKGESITLDLVSQQYKPQTSPDDIVKPLRYGSPLICLICKTGTATVRVFKLR